jgi:tetratricopeptide (TPR) repeat protein
MPYQAIAALEQLDDDGLRKVGIQSAVHQIGTAALECPDRSPSDQQKTDLTAQLDIANRVERVLGASDELSAVKLMILSKLGRLEEAIQVARQAYEAKPNWTTAVATANALRRQGDVEGALAMFQAAAGHDPKDVTALLDAGDLNLNHQRWQSALGEYERALERESDHAWALPSACYCRYRLSGDGEWLDRVRAMAAEPADECGVADTLAQVFGGYSSDHRRRRAMELLDRHEAAGQ